MFKFLPYVLAGFLISMLLIFGLRQKQEEVLQNSYRPPVEQSLSDFTFKTLDGRELRLSELHGKVVLVNFWATWCPPCKEEMPIFEREYKRCKDKGFEILAVNMDSSESNLQKFLKENRYSFSIVRPSKDLEKELKLMGFPTSYLLDREGNIYRIRLGVYRELEEDLKKLLGC
ncbi:TlpA disulfide reductase family protein [Hydrogenobacter sp. T-2]|uniref:TlpA disulfide reductase family protein n=1 Tax=Pampinifervens diazotrophicum TaxID=1632018 RepID=UPI002B25AC57|nr:TlpA disulfide reductase family protein [Hydrogenobacter sp. T-2]WPM31382.1 TlpA disulfide reductase family protein [Hydrogenobacter sp. T-2]